MASYYSVVSSGSWCSACNNSGAQYKLAFILENIFNAKSQTVRPNWLKNPETNYNLEIDIYFSDLKLAVEYNGEQHYKCINWSGRMTDEEMQLALNDIKNRDLIKKQIIEKRSDMVEHFIVFSYNDDITDAAVRAKLKKEGVF